MLRRSCLGQIPLRANLSSRTFRILTTG